MDRLTNEQKNQANSQMNKRRNEQSDKRGNLNRRK